MKFRPDIQGMRALASLLVVFYHSGLGILPGGYVGVDIFFVISGYLIAAMLISEIETTGTIDLWTFYARRARRLLPVASIVIIVGVLISHITFSPLELRELVNSGIASAVYLSNFWFAKEATDYLAATDFPNPFLHTWSLSVEEQFYVFWPLALLVSYRLSVYLKRPRTMLVCIVSLSLASLVFCVVLTNYSQPWAFFSPFSRVWEFGAGAVTAIYVSKRLTTGTSHSGYLAYLAMTSLAIISVAYSHDTTFPGYLAIFPVLATCILIANCGESSSAWLYQLLSARPSIVFGNISYSLYLWHWPVFIFVNHYFGKSVLVSCVGIAVSILLGLFTYYCFENPLRYRKWFADSNLRSTLMAAAFIATALLCCALVNHRVAVALDSPIQKSVLRAQTETPRNYQDGCHVGFREKNPKICSYGTPTAKNKIVLFGDSHAAHWVPALVELLGQTNSSLIPVTKSACPAFDFEPNNEFLGRNYFECTMWRQKAIELIHQTNPSLLIIANSHGYRESTGLSDSEWRTSIDRLMTKLSLPQTKTVIISDIPSLPFDGPNCVSRADYSNKLNQAECLIVPLAMRDIGYSRVEMNLNYPNLNVIDMTDAICDNDSCQILRDSVILYKDSHHLSVEFSRQLANPLLQKLPDF